MTLSVRLIMTKGDGFLSDGSVSGLMTQRHTQDKEKSHQENDNQRTDKHNPRPDRVPGHMLIVQFASVPPLAPVDELGMRRTAIARINKLSAVFTAAPFHRPPKWSQC